MTGDCCCVVYLFFSLKQIKFWSFVLVSSFMLYGGTLPVSLHGREYNSLLNVQCLAKH